MVGEVLGQFSLRPPLQFLAARPPRLRMELDLWHRW